MYNENSYFNNCLQKRQPKSYFDANKIKKECKCTEDQHKIQQNYYLCNSYPHKTQMVKLL